MTQKEQLRFWVIHAQSNVCQVEQEAQARVEEREDHEAVRCYRPFYFRCVASLG